VLLQIPVTTLDHKNRYDVNVMRAAKETKIISFTIDLIIIYKEIKIQLTKLEPDSDIFT
jgi:hypothetical protein